MKVTQVERQKKNPKRFNVYLDGQFGFGADEDLVVERRLVAGKVLSPIDLEKILFDAEVGKLMVRVYGLLNIRIRSEKEIRDYLKNLSFKRRLRSGDLKRSLRSGDLKRKAKESEEISDVVIESLIAKLKGKGLLNDLEFAKAWVLSRGKKKGSNLLKVELFKKGIGRETVEQVLSIKDQVLSEGQVAQMLLEKRLPRLIALPHLEQKQKALEFLVRRGFSYTIAKEVVEKLLKKA